MSTRISLSSLFLLIPLTGCPGTLLLGADASGGGEGCPDADADGVTTCQDDCDDADPNNFPGNEEVCDGADNDCDGEGDPGGVDFLAKGTLEGYILMWPLEDGGVGDTVEVADGAGIAYAPVAGDFNSDGLLDLLVERFLDWPDPDSVEMEMYLGDCEGNLELVGEPEGLEVFDDVDIHSAADIDGNGTVDVVGWGFGSGDGYVWLGNGDGTFSSSSDDFALEWWGPYDDQRREFVAQPLLDTTDDGLPDLFECTNFGGQETRCLFSIGNGEGGFTVGSDFTLDALLVGGALGDFDGDGDTDILGGLDDDGDSGQVWMWVLEDQQVVDVVEAFDVNPGEENSQNEAGYGWLYPFDADGDGDLDVVTATQNPFLEGPMDLHLIINAGGSFEAPRRFGTALHPLSEFSMWIQVEVAVPVHAFASN